MPNPRPTANDRFKQANGTRTWGAIAVAAVIHFGVLALWPAATPAELAAKTPPIPTLHPPPDVPIPPAPDDVPRPVAPVVTVDAPVDVTIPPTAGRWVPALPPPPGRDRNADTDPNELVPYTVAPELLNRDAVARELRRRYPALLRDAGMEATTILWVHVSVDGLVTDGRVRASSGMEVFDAAALAVARTMEFRPALNLDRKVAVWVEIPVRFRIR